MHNIRIRWPILLLLAVAITDGGMFAYLRFIDVPGWPSDALAHVLNAQLVWDSITPGFSQIGFWPPLLHLILLPAVSIDAVRMSDVSGFITLFPILYIASYCLVSVVRIVTGETKYGMFAACLFLLNPYVLYFSVAPMTEVIFISSFLVMLFSWLRWVRGGSDLWMMMSSLMVSVMFLSRYEGIVMIPLSIPLFFGSAVYRGARFSQAASLTLMSTLLASLGLAWVFLYGLYYGGDAFAFLTIGVRSSSSNTSTAARIASSALALDLQSWVLAWRASVAAASLLMGDFFWLAGCCAGILAAFFSRGVIRLGTITLSAIPFLSIFLLIALHRAAVITPLVPLPNYPPGDYYHNTRYLLPAIIFPVIGAAVLLSSIAQSPRWMRWLKFPVAGIFLFAVCMHSYHTIGVDRFQIIRKDITRIDAKWQLPEDGKTLIDTYYEGGFVLAVRYFAEVQMMRSHVPLHFYVHEGTYHFINQVLREPWLFARMVIVNFVARGPEIARLRQISDTDVFKGYYDEVYRDSNQVIYRLNETAMRKAARELGYRVEDIPSLNYDDAPWDPEKVYEDIQRKYK